MRLDAGEEGASFTGHYVTITGQRNDPAADAVVPFATSAPTTGEGLAALRIPARAAIVGDIELAVLAPDGDVLMSSQRGGATLPESITIAVPPRAYGTTQQNTAPTAGRPTRVRGRVIDSDGKQVGGGLQVVLWGATAPNPEAADFRALIATTTDGQGHFSGPYPVGTFSSAHASIATGNTSLTVPVHLDAGVYPDSVILVVDLPQSEDTKDYCGCGDTARAPRLPDATELGRADGTFSEDATAGRCVDFTRPDRTLYEFSFSYVVRTTEPEIRGLELQEPTKVDVKRVLTTIGDTQVVRPRRGMPLTAGGRPGDDAVAGAADGREVDAAALEGAIDARVMKTLARDPDGFSLTAIASAAYLTRHGDLLRLLGTALARAPGRRQLSCANPVDWGRRPHGVPGLHDCARTHTSVHAGVRRGRLFDGHPAVQPAAGAGPEEADRDR